MRGDEGKVKDPDADFPAGRYKRFAAARRYRRSAAIAPPVFRHLPHLGGMTQLLRLGNDL
jgi:hypothetical protein